MMGRYENVYNTLLLQLNFSPAIYDIGNIQLENKQLQHAKQSN